MFRFYGRKHDEMLYDAWFNRLEVSGNELMLEKSRPEFEVCPRHNGLTLSVLLFRPVLLSLCIQKTCQHTTIVIMSIILSGLKFENSAIQEAALHFTVCFKG